LAVASLTRAKIREFRMPRFRRLLSALWPALALAVALPGPAADRPTRPDASGSLLPPGALVRLGTTRFQHGGLVTGLAFSGDGRLVASASADGTLRLWETATGTERRQVRLDWPSCVALSPDGRTVAAGTGVGDVVLWDAGTGRPVHAIGSHRGPVDAVTFSPDGTRLASSGADETICLWDVAAGRMLHRLSGRARALAFAPDGRTLASAGAGVRLWDADAGRPLARLGSPAVARSVAFSPDGRLLAAAGDDPVVRLWKVATRDETRPLPGHGAGVRAVSFAGNRTLVTAALDGTVRVFDVPEARCLHVIPAGAAGAAFACAPDGKTLAVAGPDHRIDLWDADTGKPINPLPHRPGRVTGLAWSADGRSLASGGGDGAFRLWDPATGTELRRWDGAKRAAVFLALSPDGRTLAGGAPGQPVRLWDPATGKERRCLPERPGDPAGCVAFTPDGRGVVVGYQGGDVRFWDVATGAEGRAFGGSGGAVVAVALSPDGKLLAAATEDSLSLWDVGTGTLRHRWQQVRAGAALAFAPDGGLIASAGEDGLVALCDTATGELVRQLAGHPGETYALAFSPDGRTLASGGYDPVVRLWEVSSAQEVGRFAGHAGPVRALAFAPDGRRLASGGDDATLLVWDVAAAFEGPRPAAGLTPSDLDRLWSDLAGLDGPRAYRAVWALAAAPRQSVPAARARLSALLGVESGRVAQLIAQLDDNSFAVRERATKALEDLLPWAEPALRRTLARPPSLEVQRRIEQILATATDRLPARQQRLRLLRVIDFLERAATSEARRCLEGVAAGAPDPDVKREARVALDRLARRGH
jgi:WD40 repeat protein